LGGNADNFHQISNRTPLKELNMSDQVIPTEKIDIRSVVRERYGAIADKAKAGLQSSCCEPSESACCGPEDASPEQISMVSKMYEDPDVTDLPAEVTDISLGCGDPVTLAALEPGQTVLDLGSGGGIDCFLAAKKVGPTGKVIGVDMTAAMIEKARTNKEKVGADNVEFRLGEIEHLPVADNTIDVIISNCVVNLSPDKLQVFREAFRVMNQGGKLAVSDIVTDGPLPAVIKNSLSAWAGCIAGALDVNDYVAAIEAAGFVDVEVKPTFWDESFFEAAVEQLDPELKDQVKQAQADGKAVFVVNEGIDGDVIEVDLNENQGFDPRKAVYSAKVTAFKPS
jgi:arsenite methyltransferase